MGGFTKKQVEDMSAGFKDGMREAIRHLREMGVIEITADEDS